MSSIFDRAIKLKIIKYNPMSAVETPRPEKTKAQAMTSKEYHKLLSASEDNKLINTFFISLLMTGLRRSEAMGLEWEDINLPKGVIDVRKRYIVAEDGPIHEEKTKTKSSKRQIKMPDKLRSILKNYKKYQMEMQLQMGPDYDDSKNFVFCRPDGRQYLPGYYSNQFKKYARKAGLHEKYSLHTLRHTFATLNLANGIQAKVVQEMLGHSTISTTLDIYSHVDLDMQKEAADKINKAVDVD